MGIEVNNVSKNFRKNKKVLNNVSFSVKEGEIFLLAGPNGSGKTTLMNIIFDFIRPSSGSIVFPKDKDNILSSYGILFENEFCYSRLTPYQTVRFFSDIYGLKNDYYQLLKDFNLHEIKDKSCIYLSKGYRRRLELLITFLHHPNFVYLDEPVAGLDIKTIDYMKHKILEYSNQEKLIIINSHNMYFAWDIADKVGFINNGRLLKVISKDEKRLFEATPIIKMDDNENNRLITLPYPNYIAYQKIKVLVQDQSEYELLRKKISGDYKELIPKPEDIYKIFSGEEE